MDIPMDMCEVYGDQIRELCYLFRTVCTTLRWADNAT